jgi:hypothetical protein
MTHVLAGLGGLLGHFGFGKLDLLAEQRGCFVRQFAE